MAREEWDWLLQRRLSVLYNSINPSHVPDLRVRGAKKARRCLHVLTTARGKYILCITKAGLSACPDDRQIYTLSACPDDSTRQIYTLYNQGGVILTKMREACMYIYIQTFMWSDLILFSLIHSMPVFRVGYTDYIDTDLSLSLSLYIYIYIYIYNKFLYH